MKLASVHLGGSQWVIGELLRGLPPPALEADEDEAEAEIEMRDAVIIVPLPIPIEAPSLVAGQTDMGLMGGDLLIGTPLPSPLYIYYGNHPLVWQHLEIDEGNPPAGGVVRRYCEIRRRMPPAPAPADGGQPSAGRESKRTLRTS